MARTKQRAYGVTRAKSLQISPMPFRDPHGANNRLAQEQASRIDALEALCGELYQVLGAAGASERVLDKVYAAADGKPIPTFDLLPINEMDFDEIKERQHTIDEMATLLAKHLAVRGGRSTSDAKRQAARANGRKGGRPRKNAGV
jgi:hypothetical protein